MGVLYFVPARRFPNSRVPDVLKARGVVPAGDGPWAPCLEDFGLGHLAGAGLTYRGVRGAGPDGGAGLVIGLGTPANETGYYGENQVWQPVEGGNLYVGWPTVGPPVPDVFLRKEALPGSSAVKMGDGHIWEFTPSSALPEVLTYDGAGQMALLPRESDAAHFAASEWLMTYVVERQQQPYLEILQRVVTCLQARYHVSLVEVLALRLFTTDLNTRIVLAALGLDYEEVVNGKKNEDLTAPDTNSGAKDECPA